MKKLKSKCAFLTLNKTKQSRTIQYTIMRTVTNNNRILTATDEFDSVFGTSLIACLGDFLPYSVVKKIEGVERLKLFVRMSLDDGVDMMVIINDINVYNKCITYSDCSNILFALDDLTEINQQIDIKT